MSRRVSAIQRTVVTRKTISPNATMYQLSVSETMASAEPAALMSGRMLERRHVDLLPDGRRAVGVALVAHAL